MWIYDDLYNGGDHTRHMFFPPNEISSVILKPNS